MLGVPGNISSCTLLHGIHLISVLQTFSVKVVGDDALGQIETGSLSAREDLISLLSNIGDVSFSKTNWWGPEEEGGFSRDYRWQYCKRPIDRIENRVYVGEMYTFPPVAIMLDWSDSFHTKIPTGSRIRRKKTASQLLAFVRQFQGAQICDDEISLIDRFLRAIRVLSGIEEDPRFTDGGMIVPRRFSGPDVFTDLLESHWHCLVRLGVPLSCVEQVPLEKGQGYVGKKKPGLKLIQDMGHGEFEMVQSDFVVRDDPERFLGFVSGDVKASHLAYHGHVDIDTPDWMIELVTNDLPLKQILETDESYDTSTEDSDRNYMSD